jgi:UDP-glucose 4-epimerase
MKIVVTGSSGQIGTNLALKLLSRGDQVLGVDCRPNSWTNSIETAVVDLVAVGRRQTPWLPPFKPDAIVHLAAHAKVFELVKEPHKALENIEMAFAALEMSRATGAPILFGSSREVYGDIHHHVTEENMADFVVAESPYSASKIAGEALFYSYARCYGIPHVVFRFSNVYGRYDNDLARLERVIPLFMQKIARGEPITVFGRNKTLDFTYIDDCIAGVTAGIDALVAGRVVNQTINLAYGQGQTLYDLVNLIELAVGKPAQVTYKDSQTGEVTHYVADISKAKKLLGYCPRVPLTLGIRKYAEWWRENGWI